MGQEFENNLWRNRGYLPHYDATSKYQMITYRLADSLPQKVLHKLKEDNSGFVFNPSNSDNPVSRPEYHHFITDHRQIIDDYKKILFFCLNYENRYLCRRVTATTWVEYIGRIYLILIMK